MPQTDENIDLGFSDAEMHDKPPHTDEPAPIGDEPKPEPEKVPAEDPPIKFKDEVRSTDWAEFERKVLAARAIPDKVILLPVPTARQSEQTRLEQEAGRRAVAKAEAQRTFRNPGTAVPDAREIAAQPTTTAVFRPREFDEYKGTFKSPAITVSKDKRG